MNAVAVLKISKWLFEIIYPVTCTISTILSIYNYHCVLTCSAYRSTEMFQQLHYLTHFRGGRFELDSNCMNVKKKAKKKKKGITAVPFLTTGCFRGKSSGVLSPNFDFFFFFFFQEHHIECSFP